MGRNPSVGCDPFFFFFYLWKLLERKIIVSHYGFQWVKRIITTECYWPNCAYCNSSYVAIGHPLVIKIIAISYFFYYLCRSYYHNEYLDVYEKDKGVFQTHSELHIASICDDACGSIYPMVYHQARRYLHYGSYGYSGCRWQGL